jgi:hypothetical protein
MQVHVTPTARRDAMHQWHKPRYKTTKADCKVYNREELIAFAASRKQSLSK